MINHDKCQAWEKKVAYQEKLINDQANTVYRLSNEKSALERQIDELKAALKWSLNTCETAAELLQDEDETPEVLADVKYYREKFGL